MSVQPLAPVSDLELIEHLDLDPAVPCENQPPFHVGDEPAMYAIRNSCHPPDGSLFPVCLPCWERMGTYWLWQCTICGRHMFGRDRAFVIVTVIGRPR